MMTDETSTLTSEEREALEWFRAMLGTDASAPTLSHMRERFRVLVPLVDRTIKQDLTVAPRVREAVEQFDRLADRLDSWADESVKGGWSTHQVGAQQHHANECRRFAARLRRALVAEATP